MPLVLIGSDAAMLEHRTPAGHPERPERLEVVLERLASRIRASEAEIEPREASDEELVRVHTPAHLDIIRRADEAGGARVEVDTWTSPGSQRAGRLAAGLALAAVDAVLAGRAPRAFCAIRPPGHHARPMQPMGFCLYGNAAIAAAHAVSHHKLDRVLVVDFDVHHGNGTQEMFYDDPRVAFLSMHRFPFYPGSGAADETGTGRGLGLTKNLPIAFGTDRKAIVEGFRAEVEAFADQVKPQLVIISAGFDAHARDPVGNLGLESEDYAPLTQTVCAIADNHCGGRVVSLLEGGYNLKALAECVEVHLDSLGADAAQ